MGKGRAPCCDRSKVKRGKWSAFEDTKLIAFIQKHGHPNWKSLPFEAGLLRCGKSCRLRWINYLRPDIKRGNITLEEEDTIIKLHQTYGNKWSKIASHLPGRTDNEIKNVWNTHLKIKVSTKQINENNNHLKHQPKDQLLKSSLEPSSSSLLTTLSVSSCHPNSDKHKEELQKEVNDTQDDHDSKGSCSSSALVSGSHEDIIQFILESNSDPLCLLGGSTDPLEWMESQNYELRALDSSPNPNHMYTQWLKYLEEELGLKEYNGENELIL